MFVTLGFYRHAAFLFWRSQYRFTFTSYMFKSWTVKMHTDKRSSTCVFKHPLVLFFDWNSCVQLVKIQNLPIHIQTHTYTHNMCEQKIQDLSHKHSLQGKWFTLFWINATYTVIKIQDNSTCTYNCWLMNALQKMCSCTFLYPATPVKTVMCYVERWGNDAIANAKLRMNIKWVC